MALLEEIWTTVDTAKYRDNLNREAHAAVERLEQSRDFCLF
jgi:hypothetical protein